jgi:hypothetical protein
MAFLDGRDEADALEEAAIGLGPSEPAAAAAPDRPGPPDRRAPAGLLAAIAVVVVLLLMFAARPAWYGRGDGFIFPVDQMADQRLADLAAEQRLTEARSWAWTDRPVIDAHVSTYAAQSTGG